MKTKPVFILSALLFAAGVITGIEARGQRGPRELPPEAKAAFQACFREAGVEVNEGERPNPTTEQREKVRSCLDAKGISPPPHGGRGHHGGPEFEKMKACLQEAGIAKPAKGERPERNEATKAAFEACRAKLNEPKE